MLIKRAYAFNPKMSVLATQGNNYRLIDRILKHMVTRARVIIASDHHEDNIYIVNVSSMDSFDVNDEVFDLLTNVRDSGIVTQKGVRRIECRFLFGWRGVELCLYFNAGAVMTIVVSMTVDAVARALTRACGGDYERPKRRMNNEELQIFRVIRDMRYNLNFPSNPKR